MRTVPPNAAGSRHAGRCPTGSSRTGARPASAGVRSSLVRSALVCSGLVCSGLVYSGLGACAAAPPAERRVPVTAANLPDVQKAGYTVVNRDGQKLYCRRERLTGSHARYETSCLTAEELEALKESTQRGLEAMRRTRPPRQDGG